MAISVSFVDTSTPGPSGPITAWAWDFGDSGTSSSENPTHSYAAAGTYTVTLTVTGTGSDGTATTSQIIPVSDLSVLTADFTNVVTTLTVAFTDTSTAGPSGPITGRAWTFGDGGTSTATNPSHTYAAGGTYNVTLTVTGTSPDGTATVTYAVPVAATPPTPTAYRPYISTSAINKTIPSSPPIHPASSSMISAATGWLLGGTAYDANKQWLLPDRRALYYRGNLSLLSTVPVYVNYFQVSGVWGYHCATTPVNMPMPSWFTTILASTNLSGDRNIVLVDSTNGDEWEAWHITPPGMASLGISCSSSRWNAVIGLKYPNDTFNFTGYDNQGLRNSASASAIHYAAGLLIPEDFADCFSGSDPGTVIPHAIRITAHPVSDGTTHPRFVSPARQGDGKVAGGIPEGARVQLDPTINVGTWPSVNAVREPWRSALKKILRTFQQYGGFPGDRQAIGGGLDSCHPGSVTQGTQYGTGYKFPWEAAGYSWGSQVTGIPYDLMSHFRVIDWTKWTGV